jgi:RNA polymerase sigma factor (sigma-70 family)
VEPNRAAARLGSVIGPEPASFAAIYDSQYDPMMRLAYLTTDSVAAAEDIVQDAFVDLYSHLPEVVDPVRWLHRAVANRSVSWLRRIIVARRYLHRAHAAVELPAPRLEDTAVRQALLRLRPRHRAAVFLRFYLDLSEADIAVSLGCRPGTVKSMLHRALAMLREDLDEA